jgi:ABC-type lipoprotein export system ATPase subunit
VELITIENLWKTYHIGGEDVPVLKGVSMTVRRGELVALTGSSGCGKSTLMNTLGCLDRPTSGKYWLDGIEISQLAAEKRAVVRGQKIGFVFQNFSLLARTSALDNVMMPLTYAVPRPSAAAGRKKAIALLEKVGLGERLYHHPSQLSGGQQQRVAIARSLINDPPLLPILLVTHDPAVAQSAERIVFMRDGVIESGAFAPERAAAA